MAESATGGVRQEITGYEVMKEQDYRGVIKEVGRGAHGARALSRADARKLFGQMLDGAVPDMELGAIIMAYRIKGESVEDLQGFEDALTERTARIDLPVGGPLAVVLPSYNGARKLPNLTALVALLLKARGIPVLIHGVGQGGPDSYGRISTAEVLAALGMAASRSVDEAGDALRAGQLAYLLVEQLCAGLSNLLDTRSRLGVRGSAHTVTKMLDPFAGRSVRVVPLTHPAYFDTMRPCLVASGSPAILMRGSEGEPYAGPRRPLSVERIALGDCVVLEEGRPTDTRLPEQIDAVTTARWIESALQEANEIPATILRQVEWLENLARGG